MYIPYILAYNAHFKNLQMRVIRLLKKLKMKIILKISSYVSMFIEVLGSNPCHARLPKLDLFRECLRICANTA